MKSSTIDSGLTMAGYDDLNKMHSHYKKILEDGYERSIKESHDSRPEIDILVDFVIDNLAAMMVNFASVSTDMHYIYEQLPLRRTESDGKPNDLN